MGKLDDKTAVVTGGGRGIGRGIATRLAQEGASVVIADIDAGGAKAAAEAIASATGSAVMGVACDVTDRDSTRAAIAAAVQRFGRLDIMFNNAGISKTVRFLETTEADFDNIMRVNARGTFLGMQEAAEQFKRQGGGGKIINTASIAGKSGFPLFAAYSASKFAVIGLTQAGARALAEDGITVNAFCPGVVTTELWEQLDDEFIAIGETSKPGEALESFGAGILVGRLSTPDDITGLALFLASPDADYITGQAINVDGGMIFH
ncbi:MAG TPA: glucose 1-dehydrogenase [Baekduia sp.]|nr:glucose 1-dehydrogenase [Baekduia sp.]